MRARLAELLRRRLRPLARGAPGSFSAHVLLRLAAAWSRVWRTGALTGAPDCGPPLGPEDPAAEAAALRHELTTWVLPFWRAHAVDPGGGYIVHLRRDGSAYDDRRRFAAMQARMVYAYAIGHQLDPAAGDLARAEHGVRFLNERFLDERQGGFRHTLDRDADDKVAFDQAYVCIGLLAWHAASGDPRALARVEHTVERMEGLWDAERHGYAERGDRTFHVKTPVKTICVQLDMLAALLDLAATRSAACGFAVERARRLGDLIVEHFLDPTSGLVLEALSPALRYDVLATGDRVLLGHNLKAAYHLLELGRRHGGQRFITIAEELAERCLARGWDLAHGGFFQEVFRAGGVASNRKPWWPQTEALALLYSLHAVTGAPRWLALARRHADLCRAWFQDPVHGGWITETHRDGTPSNDHKGGDYKAALHEVQGWYYAAQGVESWRRVPGGSR